MSKNFTETNRFLRNGITIVIALVLFAVKLTTQDTIRFTWSAEWYSGKTFLQQPCKRIILQATNGKEFTVSWGDGTIKTIISDNDNSYLRATILNHTYEKTGEYSVIITTSDPDCKFTYFDCSGNQLTSLDLTGCLALTRLRCDGNQLTSLNLTGCLALTELDCRRNQLKNLDLTSCSALTELDCENNKLASLDLTAYSTLIRLDCNNNQLANLDVSGYSTLTVLYCANNQLKNLNLTGCSTLTTLDCRNNQLTSLDLTACSALQSLKCQNNQLQLSDLFALHLLIDDENYKTLGEQNLPLQTVIVGKELFVEQSVFNGIFTSYDISKDKYYDDEEYYDYEDYYNYDNYEPVPENDYTVIDGKLKFNTVGKYKVTMANEAIVSIDIYPVEVIVEIIVKKYIKDE